MKITEKRIKESSLSEEEVETKNGYLWHEFEDNHGNKIEIKISDGRILITAASGILVVLPRAANAIILETIR